MKNFIYKHRVLWISLIVATLVVVSMGSCTATRSGCGTNSGFIGYR